jgi:hypothetical protein
MEVKLSPLITGKAKARLWGDDELVALVRRTEKMTPTQYWKY